MPQCSAEQHIACQQVSLAQAAGSQQHWEDPYRPEHLPQKPGASQFRHIQKEGKGKGGICICLPVHCLSVRPDRQPYCHTNATSPPCWKTTACQCTVGTSLRGDIVLWSRLPLKCRYLCLLTPCLNMTKQPQCLGLAAWRKPALWKQFSFSRAKSHVAVVVIVVVLP